jgi:hypothetical protein
MRPGLALSRALTAQAREHDNSSKSGLGATCEVAAGRILDSVMN